MAKNSIGKFISVLRKANGLTQQDVANRLNVSNKAVSRWEREECAPDLSLIPALAEMFGATCDELLRGEKNNPNDAREENAEKSKAKADKQFRALLRGRMLKYNNLALLSAGLTLCGAFASFVANLAFSRGLIAFVLAAFFAAASEICQICFARNSFIRSDDETSDHSEQIDMAATSIVKTTVKITFANLLLAAFCLPSAVLIDGANFGLAFQSWLWYGFLFAFTAFLVFYLVYSLIVRKFLIRSKLLIYDDMELKKLDRQKHILKGTAAVSVGIAAMIGIGILVFNTIPSDSFAKREVFTSPEEFKAYMESEYDNWLTLSLETDPPLSPEEINKEYGEIKNSGGEVICSYYYNPDLYFSIRFTDSSDDAAPITVITQEAAYSAFELKKDIRAGLYMLIALDFVIAAGIYIWKASAMKTK